MPFYLVLQSDGVSKFTLQSGGGSLLLQSDGAAADVFIVGLHRIREGMIAVTAAGMNGVLET